MIGNPMIFYWCWLAWQSILMFYICHDYIIKTKQYTMYTLFWDKKWAVGLFKAGSKLTIYKMIGRDTPERAAPTIFCFFHSLF